MMGLDACDNDPGYWDLTAKDVKSIASDQIYRAERRAEKKAKHYARMMTGEPTLERIIFMLDELKIPKDVPKEKRDRIYKSISTIMFSLDMFDKQIKQIEKDSTLTKTQTKV